MWCALPAASRFIFFILIETSLFSVPTHVLARNDKVLRDDKYTGLVWLRCGDTSSCSVRTTRSAALALPLLGPAHLCPGSGWLRSALTSPETKWNPIYSFPAVLVAAGMV